jgi:hypothetical protein
MKNKFLKTALSVSVVLAASGFAMQAQAHCLTQTLASGSASSATQDDVYVINCPTGTTSVYGRLGLISGATSTTYQFGAAGNGNTTATLNDTGASATMACKAAGTDGVAYEHLDPTKTPTAYASYAAIPGINTLVVTKNSASASSYAIEFHCMNGAAGGTAPLGGELGGNFEVAGPGLAVPPTTPTGLTDALDAVSGSPLPANDTNLDANLVINH